MPNDKVKPIDVVVIGVGLVGSEFLEQVIESPHPFRLVLISSSKTTIFSPDGICFPNGDWNGLLKTSSPKLDLAEVIPDLAASVKRGSHVVVVDNTSSDDVAALYPDFLKAGLDVITPNKKAYSGELSLYERIVEASLESGAKFLNEATVGAGLPIISTLKDLIGTGDTVTKIEGVFSGTMSYIFNEFSTGKADGPSFSSVVKVAREKGYTEPHPADDLNGADVARKLTILSRLIPSLRSALPDGYKSVTTTSLVPEALKAVATGDEFISHVQNGLIKADLERYPDTHPFATSLGGSDNIIMFHTKRYGARPLIVQGAGAGAAVTAMGVMSDMLKLV
ncbi:hypothetical protein EWM64_g3933 [Hericium alpestre]|uniref:homoserine dehydrogenase n=1 Tax=Hericium alpestre TaxID=135208 RepID=A0A4Y9ZZ18_9AGAM|nr:hypothetical protein EWM64_g3933 [Hericium alpestre]